MPKTSLVKLHFTLLQQKDVRCKQILLDKLILLRSFCFCYLSCRTLQELVEESDLMSRDKQGKTPLHLACEGGFLNVAKVLLSKGAFVDHQDDQGNTSLCLACQNGHPMVAKVLLDKGADINLVNLQGNTPLSLACKCGHYEVAEKLLAKGADFVHKNVDGSSPLNLAARNDCREIVKLLLKQ